MRILSLFAWISGCLALLPPPVLAQVVPDSSDSIVTASVDRSQFVITGGSAAERNLFHSFDRFSLNAGQTAVFSPDPAIATIITRVTGTEASKIDGTIAVYGNANLFLMNPNGIVFGQSAALAIKGSFFATTAPGLRFADGTMLSANRSEPPLLTISAPIGVIQPTAPISNAGHLHVGQNLSIVAGAVSGSGQFTAGNRIVIIADTVTLDQARIAAKSGINLDVQNGIALESSQLKSAVGDIEVKARSLSMSEGATINTEIPSDVQGRSGNINLKIQDAVTIRGEAPNGTPSGITSVINGRGTGGTIAVNSGSLQMFDGSQIFTGLNGSGNAGSIEINSRNNLELQGAGNQQTRIGSGVSATGIGQGGDVRLTAETVSLADRAKIDAYTDGAGIGGGIQVTARDSISVTGTGRVEPIWTELVSTLLLSQNLTFENGMVTDQGRVLFPIQDVIASTTKQTGILAGSAIGKTGDIQLTAPRIAITNQALISSNNWQIGDSGSIKLNASDAMTVNNSYLLASVLIGKGADLTLNTPELRVNQSKIVTGTGYATGGTITLNVPRVLLLRNNSTIAARSYNNANGGNININAGVIVANPNENSDIVANAFRGRGGNIQITARSLVGINNHASQTNQSDISASSRFGIRGAVKLNVLRSDPGSEAVKLPTEVTDSSTQIGQTCSARSRVNSFTRTGRGGIAPDLAEINRSTPIWTDSRSASSVAPPVKASQQIVEATGWIKNSEGQVVLVADGSDTPLSSSVACEP